jgi:small subunit ribosomal protein S14
MARKSKIEKNKRRVEIVAKHADRRAQLKQAVRSPKSTVDSP